MAIMDIKSFQAFSILTRTGSIRQTADILNTSPTAISRQLDKLEHGFDAELVIRGPRGVTLTSAGEIVAEKAAQIVQSVSQTREMIGDLKGLRHGTVTLCVNGAAASAFLAPVLADFTLNHPNIQINVNLASAKEALEALIQGTADIAVSMFAKPDARLQTYYRSLVRHEPILSPDHPLAEKQSITMTDLQGHPLALPDESYDIRLAFDAKRRAAGFEDDPVMFTSPSLGVQVELARRARAVLILPEMAVARAIAEGALIVRPFAPEARIETTLDVSQSITRPQSFAARRMIEFLQAALQAREEKT